MNLRKTQMQELKFILGEANRSMYERKKKPPRIDPTLTEKNIVLYKGQDDDKKAQEIIKSCENKKALRPNQVVLACWVIQPNETIQRKDYGKFFAESINFVKDRYGNLFNAYIHQDEPNAVKHIHILFAPYIKGTKILNAKKVLNATECFKFHREFGTYMSEKLGYKVSMLDAETIKDEVGNAFTPKDLKDNHKLIENNKRLQKELKETKSVIKETLDILKDNAPTSYKNFNVAMNKVIEKKPNIFYKVKNFFKNLFHRKNNVINNEKQLVR